ncbi:MAG: UxaA family hydrolase [Bacillota bacterium]|jgi:altronate dehydratase small subunit|nr:UxaA family hydrolase [Eubacteriales bacterium]MDI9491467.1 UxaA family hydrolase [Bacillota bacterium]NLV69708.1 UxaA family hydrolase [Clostridiales bacterium]
MEEFFALQVHLKDNVATVFASPEKGSCVRVDDSNGASRKIEIKDDIPYGHKIALTEIAEREKIFKYGEVIGLAVRNIEAGEHVHVHNVASLRGRGDLAAEIAGEDRHDI